MPSFSRRRFAVTAFNQVFERLPDAGRTAESAEDDTPTAADQLFAPTGGHGLVEDVDFDTAIAEVLMTLATDRGAVEDASPSDEHETSSAVLARLERDDEASFEEDSDSEGDDADGEAVELDPEALLAAEAATFRLLGELDRLWHKAA